MRVIRWLMVSAAGASSSSSQQTLEKGVCIIFTSKEQLSYHVHRKENYEFDIAKPIFSLVKIHLYTKYIWYQAPVVPLHGYQVGWLEGWRDWGRGQQMLP